MNCKSIAAVNRTTYSLRYNLTAAADFFAQVPSHDAVDAAALNVAVDTFRTAAALSEKISLCTIAATMPEYPAAVARNDAAALPAAAAAFAVAVVAALDAAAAAQDMNRRRCFGWNVYRDCAERAVSAVAVDYAKYTAALALALLK